jgi:hypothetical protein
MYLLESLKAREAVPYIKKHLALGRKVVVFHDFNKGGGFHPFRIEPLGENTDLGGMMDPEQRDAFNAALADFNSKRADLVALDFDGLQSPRVALAGAFGDSVRFFNGTETKNARARAVHEFNTDDSKATIIVVQSDAGGAGISLHDTSGKHQRALVHLGMPGKPTALIQHEGRIYRVGQASDAVFRYLSTGTNWERYTFAQRIAERASTAENFALGAEARGLKQSIIDAYQAAEPVEPSADEGKGGKALDRNLSLQSSLSDFDRAKTYYYGQQKKGGTRDQREGVDYYATPEPVGFKMVQWAGLYAGESMLEPSAGHGAIARFAPFGVKLTAVEPSRGLASRLSLVLPDNARLEESTFEDLHVSNKFSGIVMNPPFGLRRQHGRRARRQGGGALEGRRAHRRAHPDRSGRRQAIRCVHPRRQRGSDQPVPRRRYQAPVVHVRAREQRRHDAHRRARKARERRADGRAEVHRPVGHAEDINALFDAHRAHRHADAAGSPGVGRALPRRRKRADRYNGADGKWFRAYARTEKPRSSSPARSASSQRSTAVSSGTSPTTRTRSTAPTSAMRSCPTRWTRSNRPASSPPARPSAPSGTTHRRAARRAEACVRRRVHGT